MQMTSSDVKRIATELGLDDCRVARVESAALYAERLAEWVAAGEHGDMEWLAGNLQRRQDPRVVLPGVRSMVVVALNYYQKSGAGAAATSGARGRIARYAWGDDYHAVLDGKLRDLALTMEMAGGAQRLYVDTGPVLERSWATAAGLGWNGKSTVQIHRKLGTWFFLGEILTTLDLEADVTTSPHCGTCTRCMVACPTGAITAPHHVDARRCVSYLTIEHKGAIPVELRRAMGDRIYGCDECLDVCPWNRFAHESRTLAFRARPFVEGWLLRDFLRLDESGFRSLFRYSPVKRIKRSAFLRNVCVALGNVGTEEDREALVRAASEGDALITEHARWALAELEARRTRLCSA